jgi:hypothetical protein
MDNTTENAAYDANVKEGKPRRHMGPKREPNVVELGTVLRDKDRRYRSVDRLLTAIELTYGGKRYYCRVKINGVDQFRNQYIKVERLEDPSRFEVVSQADVPNPAEPGVGG